MTLSSFNKQIFKKFSEGQIDRGPKRWTNYLNTVLIQIAQETLSGRKFELQSRQGMQFEANKWSDPSNCMLWVKDTNNNKNNSCLWRSYSLANQLGKTMKKKKRKVNCRNKDITKFWTHCLLNQYYILLFWLLGKTWI